MGCPGAKLSQGSTCLSHGPSSRVSKHQFSTVRSVSTTTKFPTRYVYSARCNPSAVEMLLKMSKNYLLKLSESDVHNRQAVPVEKYDCKEITAKV